MEPSLRRAAHGLCGHCSAAVQRQLVLSRATKSFAASVPRRAFAKSASLERRNSCTHTQPAVGSRDFSSQSKLSIDFKSAEKPAVPSSVKFDQDNLFHSLSDSPVPEFRRRAAFMRQHAYCPHPDHKPTKLPTIGTNAEDAQEQTGDMAPAHVDFECPDCGVPVYCSKEHWMDHYEEHLKVCDTLRQINEDDHDLRSGRVFHEANLPDLQLDDAAVNMTNWDTFMYTREFNAVDSDRGMRQITRLLTYPVTIGSVLHELSPYNMHAGGRLTAEGLKSFSGRTISNPSILYT